MSDSKQTRKKVKATGSSRNAENRISSVRKARYISKIIKEYRSQRDWKVKRLTYKQALPVLEFLNFNQGQKAKFLDVNPSTVSRWNSSDGKLGVLSSKIVYEVDEIIEKGISVFGSEEKFMNWLENDNYALGDAKPKEMLQDPNGLELVEEALDALAWGNYI